MPTKSKDGVVRGETSTPAARNSEYAKNFWQYDLIKKVAPDYVPFFEYLDANRPGWRTNPNYSVQRLSRLLQTWEAGRAAGKKEKT